MRISFLGAVILAIVVYKIIKMIVEADRDAKLARVKADLKVKLLEKVQDPELLRDILEKDLDLSPEGLQLHKEAWDKNKELVQTRAEARRRDGGWRFVSGMLAFFLGVGLLIGSIFEHSSDQADLIVGGVIFVFLGWVILGWHVYTQERKKEALDSTHEVHDGRAHP